MPILLAFGAIAGVVFGGAGCDDLSVIDVFLGLPVLLSSPRLSYGPRSGGGGTHADLPAGPVPPAQTSARFSS
jgi:hypothetical protein